MVIKDAPQTRPSSLRTDGHRVKTRPADVNGRFTSAKRWIYLVLIAIYALLPLIPVNGNPAVLLDIARRHFYLFGFVFTPKDTYLVFFLLTGILFSLFYVTAILGRVWCGFACPQTVFLDGVFRKIERFVEGPRAAQLALAKAAWSRDKFKKFIFKHALYIVAVLAISHIFISYFIPWRELRYAIFGSPSDHPVAFMWMLVVSVILYINYAWFREQLCLIVCPYGKIQSVLIDDDTLAVGYDRLRGEPRGKKTDPTRGACIDCHRCVDVCPTGIDIREGLQLDCIGCAACIDACDDIMIKVGQAPGLIRYDSLNRLERRPSRILRPRFYVYTAFLLLGVLVTSFFILNRTGMDVVLLRLQGAPYVVTQGMIRNAYTVHLANKGIHPAHFKLEVSLSPDARVIMSEGTILLESLADRFLPIFVELPQTAYREKLKVSISVTNLDTGEVALRTLDFLGPDTF